MPNILCSRIRYIVPFMFKSNETYDDIIEKIRNFKRWQIQNMKDSATEQDLYQTILDCFTMDSDQSNIGCSLLYEKAEDQTEILKFNYTRLEENFVVSITDLGVYLFRSGIGFLWYELLLPENVAVESVILFQNEFKELSYERFVKKNEKQTRYTFELLNKQDEGLLMGDWIARLMQQFPFEVTYFAKRSNPLDASMEIPDKALLFNYIIFDEEADEASCIQDIYHLNNGYNARYAMGVDFETHLVKPFEKAYFCATAQGCGYYAIPNASNRHFYLHTKRNRVMMDYFILDILVLYQTYTVLRFTNVMEHELAAESARYLTESADTLTKLKRLSTEINVFLVKSVYSSVSHISHHNEFYDYLIRKYRVRENIEGLTIGLESLQRLQESREKERLEEIEQKKAKESEQSDNRLNIGLGLISILALISAIADGDAAFELIINLLHLPQSMKTVFDWGLLVLVIGVAIVAIKSVGKYIEQTKKK